MLTGEKCQPGWVVFREVTHSVGRPDIFKTVPAFCDLFRSKTYDQICTDKMKKN